MLSWDVMCPEIKMREQLKRMGMNEMLTVQKRLLPDLMDVLKKRYTTLRWIMLNGTIGRRALAASLNITERVLRAEVDFLKSQGLVEIDSSGMKISGAGRQLLETMEPMIKELFGLAEMEERLRRHFGLQQVVIVPGDADVSPFAKKELGRAGSAVLRKMLSRADVVAVTGGSTLAEVAECLTSPSALKEHWFVPARGGLGESVEMQANTIASTMAKRTGAHYRLLHVPDHLGEDAYQSLIQEPNIREIIDVIRKARIVVHGIGDALRMARRRGMGDASIRELLNDGASAEAFGYYFDKDGTVVQKMPTLGLRLEDIQQTEVVIAVAGGRSKGAAIAAVVKYGHEDILVTDEAAAEEILKHL